MATLAESNAPQGKYVALEDAQEVLEEVVEDVYQEVLAAFQKEMREDEQWRGITLLENAVEVGFLDEEIAQEYKEQYRDADSIDELVRIGDEISQVYVPALVPREFEIVDMEVPEEIASFDETTARPEYQEETMSLDEAVDDETFTDLDLDMDWSDYEFPVVIREEENHKQTVDSA